jgi:signal transduction histidine kinase
MQERAHLAGGRVIVDAVPGRGTRIEVNIPSGRADDADAPGDC